MHNLMSDLAACRADSQPLPEDIHAHMVARRSSLANIKVHTCSACQQ